MWSRQLDSPSASPSAPQSVSGRGWSRGCSGRAPHPSAALNDPACRKGNKLPLKMLFIPFFLPHPAMSKRSWKNGVWEMQGDPALAMRTGRSSPCAPCNGKGTPGAHPGLGDSKDMGSHVPCPYSGQSISSLQMQPCPQLSISATLAVPPSSCLPVMVGGPLICFRSVLWREGAPLTCLKQQTGSRERRSPSTWGPWHVHFMKFV